MFFAFITIVCKKNLIFALAKREIMGEVVP